MANRVRVILFCSVRRSLAAEFLMENLASE